MKKTTLLLVAVLTAWSSYAQKSTQQISKENDGPTISVYLGAGGGAHAQMGVHVEKYAHEIGDFLYFNLAYGEILYDENSIYPVSIGTSKNEVDLSGYLLEIGFKNYFSKRKPYRGFYYSNSLSYGSFEYEEGDVYGKYSYISFFTPKIGCKIMLGSFALDPYVGVMWRLEIKGKGFVDNRYTNEWMPELGLRLGWRF